MSQNKRNFYFSLSVISGTMKLVQTRKVEEGFYLDYEGQYVSLEIFGIMAVNNEPFYCVKMAYNVLREF